MFCITNIALISGLYGMEFVEQNKVKSFVFQAKPQIVVYLDDIYNRSTENAELTVVGATEQKILKNPVIHDAPLVGCTKVGLKNNSIKRKSKVLTDLFDSSYGFRGSSTAIKIQGERFIIQDLYSHIEDVIIKDEVIFVKEPYIAITSEKKGQLSYYYKKVFNEVNDTRLKEENFFAAKAIEEALKDLVLCYNGALQITKNFSTKKTIKSIAFPPLSVSLGIPAYRAAHVAIESVINFINTYRDKITYERIEFVVPQLEDFSTYKEILNRYMVESTGQIIQQ